VDGEKYQILYVSAWTETEMETIVITPIFTSLFRGKKVFNCIASKRFLKAPFLRMRILGTAVSSKQQQELHQPVAGADL